MIPNARLDFTIDGAAHVLEFRRPPLQVWRDIKAETGFTPMTLIGALSDLDVEATIAIAYASRNAAGRRVPWRQVQQDLDTVAEFEFTRFELNGEVLFGEDETEPTDPPTSGS